MRKTICLHFASFMLYTYLLNGESLIYFAVLIIFFTWLFM